EGLASLLPGFTGPHKTDRVLCKVYGLFWTFVRMTRQVYLTVLLATLAVMLGGSVHSAFIFDAFTYAGRPVCYYSTLPSVLLRSVLQAYTNFPAHAALQLPAGCQDLPHQIRPRPRAVQPGGPQRCLTLVAAGCYYLACALPRAVCFFSITVVQLTWPADEHTAAVTGMLFSLAKCAQLAVLTGSAAPTGCCTLSACRSLRTSSPAVAASAAAASFGTMTDFVVHNNDRPTLQQCRFEGSGVLHAAKYLGSAVLADGQSQLLCQEAMWSVLASLKGRKLPKERLEIRLSLADGVQIREVAAPDGAGGVSKLDLKFGHSEISYVFKEPRDQRSCGLVRTEPNPDSPGQTIHRFYAVRTVKSASPLMKDLRDLFQLVKQRRDEQRAETPVPTAPSQPARAEVAAETKSQEQQSAAASLKSEQSAAPSSPDLLDIRQQPIRQSAVSSSLGSLNKLSELFSSQASLASSGVGGDGGICGDVVSFDPWASQLLPPPPVQMARQLSQPHPAPAVQLPGEPLFRKASHPSVLEQRRLSNSASHPLAAMRNSRHPIHQLPFLFVQTLLARDVPFPAGGSCRVDEAATLRTQERLAVVASGFELRPSSCRPQRPRLHPGAVAAAVADSATGGPAGAAKPSPVSQCAAASAASADTASADASSIAAADSAAATQEVAGGPAESAGGQVVQHRVQAVVGVQQNRQALRGDVQTGLPQPSQQAVKAAPVRQAQGQTAVRRHGEKVHDGHHQAEVHHPFPFDEGAAVHSAGCSRRLLRPLRLPVLQLDLLLLSEMMMPLLPMPAMRLKVSGGRPRMLTSRLSSSVAFGFTGDCGMPHTCDQRPDPELELPAALSGIGRCLALARMKNGSVTSSDSSQRPSMTAARRLARPSRVGPRSGIQITTRRSRAITAMVRLEAMDAVRHADQQGEEVGSGQVHQQRVHPGVKPPSVHDHEYHKQVAQQPHRHDENLGGDNSSCQSLGEVLLHLSRNCFCRWDFKESA
uniref:IRS-type PTB domain-containing protein n=1 Tax=Macrostomum lignano TaxID=282301 RepID=A0A1I8GLL2_9PLAT